MDNTTKPNLSFSIEIPEYINNFSKEKQQELFEFLENKYNVESYIKDNKLMVNTYNLKNAYDFLDDDLILGEDIDNPKRNYSIIVGNGITSNFINIKHVFVMELSDILEEDILERYNYPEYYEYNEEGMTNEDHIQNILDRYNNREYWREDIIDEYFNEEGITNEEQKKSIIEDL